MYDYTVYLRVPQVFRGLRVNPLYSSLASSRTISEKNALKSSNVRYNGIGFYTALCPTTSGLKPEVQICSFRRIDDYRYIAVPVGRVRVILSFEGVFFFSLLFFSPDKTAKIVVCSCSLNDFQQLKKQSISCVIGGKSESHPPTYLTSRHTSPIFCRPWLLPDTKLDIITTMCFGHNNERVIVAYKVVRINTSLAYFDSADSWFLSTDRW